MISLEHSQRYASALERSQSALKRGGYSLGLFSLGHSRVLSSALERDPVLLMFSVLFTADHTCRAAAGFYHLHLDPPSEEDCLAARVARRH